MKLSTKLLAVGKALRLTGLGIAGSALLSTNLYVAGAGVLLAVGGEAVDGAAMVIAASGNGT